MKKSIFLPVGLSLATVISLSSCCSVCKTKTEPKLKISESAYELKSKADSASWIIGVQIAKDLNRQQYVNNLNKQALVAGFKAQFNSDSSLFDHQEGNKIIGEYIQEISKSQNEIKIKEGEVFLANNANRPEIITTPSGLQYEILVKGDGPIPNKSNTVKTHYHGTLLNGKVFDSSVERGKPTEFPVGGVIKGWVEALQLMPVGSKWKLYIPYNLAYGERGAGGAIGPYETLIFEIELIEIVK